MSRRPSFATTTENFWAKVGPATPEGCWPWAASKDRKGYGQVRLFDRPYRAHRFAYIALVGAIPECLVIDHLCRNRACVNPSHMEPVTAAENVRRGRSGALRPSLTHCKNGHELTPENTRAERGRRFRCLPCAQAADARYRRSLTTKRRAARA